MIEQLTAGGYLASWGVALLLVWLSSERLIHMAHCELARRGKVKAPSKTMLPMQSWSDPAVAIIALLCGISALIAFLVAAGHAITLPDWITPLSLPPAIELLRLCAAMAVLTFFACRVAEHPAYKAKWIAGWTVFAFWLAWMT